MNYDNQPDAELEPLTDEDIALWLKLWAPQEGE